MKKEINKVIDILTELNDDLTVPKNIKERIQNIITALKEDTEPSIKLNKALNELDEITSDVNLQPYTRTQLWNIVSILEKLQ